jgi:putative phosphoribosyl transferase
VAVPVGSPTAVRELGALADDVVCLVAPPTLRAVGGAYRDFAQTSDDEVRRALGDAAAEL